MSKESEHQIILDAAKAALLHDSIAKQIAHLKARKAVLSQELIAAATTAADLKDNLQLLESEIHLLGTLIVELPPPAKTKKDNALAKLDDGTRVHRTLPKMIDEVLAEAKKPMSAEDLSSRLKSYFPLADAVDLLEHINTHLLEGFEVYHKYERSEHKSGELRYSIAKVKHPEKRKSNGVTPKGALS